MSVWKILSFQLISDSKGFFFSLSEKYLTPEGLFRLEMWSFNDSEWLCCATVLIGWSVDWCPPPDLVYERLTHRLLYVCVCYLLSLAIRAKAVGSKWNRTFYQVLDDVINSELLWFWVIVCLSDWELLYFFSIYFTLLLREDFKTSVSFINA